MLDWSSTLVFRARPSDNKLQFKLTLRVPPHDFSLFAERRMSPICYSHLCETFIYRCFATRVFVGGRDQQATIRSSYVVFNNWKGCPCPTSPDRLQAQNARPPLAAHPPVHVCSPWCFPMQDILQCTLSGMSHSCFWVILIMLRLLMEEAPKEVSVSILMIAVKLATGMLLPAC